MAKNSFKIENMADDLVRGLKHKVKSQSVILAGYSRAKAPTDTSGLKSSIEDFQEEKENEIIGGAVTTNEYAAYVEFGTGPTGTNAGHPLDSDLGIVRKTDPWLGKIPITAENESKFHSLSEKEKEQGFAYRYVHGQEPIPFMYEAMEEAKEDILKEFSSVLKEVLHG